MYSRRPPRMSFAVVLVALIGCEAGSDSGNSDTGEGGPPFEPVADVQQLMLAVLEPAAEVYWDAVGWIVDSTGTQEIRPTTIEEWEAVRNAAYVMAESGNLLMMEGRAVDDGPWIGMSQAMIEVSQRALAAAEARDEAAVFELGGQVYQACTGCHATYAVETLRPNTQMD